MNELLRALYEHFYEPYEDKELEAEADACHKALIQVLSKEDRRLVLRIIDIQSLLAEQRSVDSFVAGFRLAWRLWEEVEEKP